LLFNEATFLFIFLPAALALYYAVPRKLANARNGVLLLVSLLYYVALGKEFVFLMIAAALFNYAAAIAIEKRRGTGTGKALLTLAVVVNLLPLIVFKYTGFMVNNLPASATAAHQFKDWIRTFGLPLGITYFAFQAISYVVDIWRGDAKADRSPLRVALYLLLFQKIVAGPIARYRDLAGQLAERNSTRELFAEGVKRFTIGLAKKALIASVVGLPAEQIFAIPTNELTPSVAWLGLICYAVQIYFDFSGYSDMAIGLGMMFGFRLPENFNYPYIADSIRDFWRRWHISLSSWLRDYLYIPLGGSRVGTFRIYFNLVIVFVICGLWHGASWAFVFWGAYYGLFLVLERLGLDKLLEKSPRPVRHIYALIVIFGGWVFFNAPSLSAAFGYLGALAGLHGGEGVRDSAGAYLNPVLLLAIAAGIIGSLPIFPWLRAWRERSIARSGNASAWKWETAETVSCVAAWFASGLMIAANSYSPFIYKQF